MVEGDQASANLGMSFASAGDGNGDGYSDVLVTAYIYDNGETDEGVVYLYHGSATGLSSSYNWMSEGNQVDARYGFSVSSAGDVNNDGYSDVIIGAICYDNVQTDEGAAFVFLGS